MNTIWQTLVHTPWWVYVILIYLIIIGIKASSTRVVALPILFIIPTIFTFMSIHTLVVSFAISTLTVATWTLAILIGVLLGWIQIARDQLKIDKEKKLIQVPGSWSTLILVLIIFMTKYYFGYELAVDPTRATQTWFEISALAISGICTGLFIGRLINYIYRFSTATSVKLDQ